MIKTLKGRITEIYLVLVALCALVGLTAVINLFSLSGAIDGLLTANYRSIKAIHQMEEDLNHQNYAITIYIRVDDRQGINNFVNFQNRFLRAFDAEKHNITEPGERELIDRLEGDYWEYAKRFARLQEVKNQSGAVPAAAYQDQAIKPQADQVRKLLERLEALNERTMFGSKDRAEAGARRSMYLILTLSLFAVAGGFGVSRYFLNRFFKPIDDLKETVKLVRAGDLGQQAAVVHPDEIGELAAEFNNMTKRLMQFEQSTVGKLMAEKNKSLAIVKSIADPLIVLDWNYRIQLINDAAAELFGTSEGQALGKHFLEVILNGELFDFISGLVDGGQDRPEQRLIVLKYRDQDYYFNAVAKTVQGAGLESQVQSIVVLLQNITQIKQLEKIKTDFIATISHEFKTPLTSMMMGLSLLAEEKIGPLNAKQAELVATIQEDSDSLAKLVADLLELSKIESDKAIFKIQPCSVGGLVEKAVKQFLALAAAAEIRLSFDVPDNLPRVQVDPEKISWVLNNLIGNALKYTNAGDEIRVSAAARHGKICVAVQDTGPGIPPEYLDKLFDKFVQVKGYDLEVRGTGLGLAIAKEIVEAHGGEIWCESRMDEGSTFLFTLPL